VCRMIGLKLKNSRGAAFFISAMAGNLGVGLLFTGLL